MNDSDWRLQGQERYLQGVRLLRSGYRAYSADWDHDHCEFCSVKFLERPAPGDLSVGYCTEDRYRWICENCFSDFRELFQWEVVLDENEEAG